MVPKHIYSLQWIFSLGGRPILRFTLLIFILFSSLIGQEEMPYNKLVEELGCGNCHLGMAISDTMLLRTPDLSYSGEKYNEAFLYAYLKEPYKVRHNIGLSRMPNFLFSDDEALAVTKYLMSRKNLPLDSKIQKRTMGASTGGFEIIHGDYQCTSCHPLNNVGKQLSTDFNETGSRLNSDWMFDFIETPEKYVPKGSSMPKFFGDDFGHGLDEYSEKTITTMVSYFFEISQAKREELDSAFVLIEQAYPNITAEMGRKIFQSQFCQACHQMTGEEIWFDRNAPDMNQQKTRTNKEWLTNYLLKTEAIRPFGFFPGTGSRMPDCRLTETEVNTLIDWIGTETEETQLEPITYFLSRKVERLIDDFLPCKGCHQMDGKGGEIGPDLSNVGERLTNEFIKTAVNNPHETLPGSIMPKTEMDPLLIPQIVSYLANKRSDNKVIYPNLVEQQPYQVTDSYEGNCAPCHGLKGDGKGFNEASLPVKPGDFTDTNQMAQRADDTLYDTIHVGGRIMNKNHFMPGWGEKMSPQEIIGFVQTIRDFCDCEQPGWAKN
ncbi:MAG: c-type cytochrome [Candidatus Marinimicrobia bacterium]|nr:c-type cytochrome [Candidatus Neomarinimicrobiota bacterium]MBL7011042.1 c-type cytochrome [Candidatus Neomarinimicrobiota bacterium]